MNMTPDDISRYERPGFRQYRVRDCDYLDPHTNVYFPGDMELTVRRYSHQERGESPSVVAPVWRWRVEHLSRDETVLAEGTERTLSAALKAGKQALEQHAGPAAGRRKFFRKWLAS